ncbi:MAG: hypothetical protein M3298_01410 [Thermoproteota archaeon]|nr:hypothetical protein [Thermoproteota archaeon]MDQ5843232.1 hypothetical protein [Thermoproteota archaeon]
MSSNVPNWDATINKVVNTKEVNLIGNVEAADESAIPVSTEGARTHYRIPKDAVEGFDGHAVSLKVSNNHSNSTKLNGKRVLKR